MSVMEGSLSKWTNVMKGWQYRWFVLDYNAGLLSYYTSKEKMMRGVRRGCVRLRAAVIGIDDEDDSTFTITVDHKTFHFQARDAEERERWVRALEDTISRHHRAGRGVPGGAPAVAGTVPAGSRPKDFERRVTEADAYLQIMIDQVKKLEDRITDITDQESRNSIQGIHDQANAMLENIKHSIVLLQIAKNTVNPVNGVYQGPASIISTTQIPSATPTDDMTSSSIVAGIEEGAECLERRHTSLQLTGGPSMTLVVPDTSYSSSEEEDDFYDADDAPFSLSSVAGTPTIASRQASTNTSVMTPSPGAGGGGGGGVAEGDEDVMYSPTISPAASPPSSSDTLPRRPDGGIDYDALYECESDNDIGSMETHGSVVTHLLSQVKIGMDLTKVVLPTFILERRSLLEMYADYFAHPEEFLKIIDMPTPRERMIQVVRWYLSSYHAGRKSAVAKKPYNPVLGEVFRCHWQQSGSSNTNNTSSSNNSSSNTDSSGQSVPDGPVPWCGPNQLTFVAEQVSHHPPISAFYAEHVNKGISFDAWVWTKSKFLGLSIGVHNIGKGKVTLTDLNEEYILTFPNGYGRSILTVPWIELGGSVSVECAATGYKAAIEFLTKPFYGGRRNRVTCEIFAPGEKRPFVTSSGEWNTKMDLKWTDTGRTEILFDSSHMKPHKKLVRPIDSQANNESRNVWKDVTAGLKSEDIEGATRAKCRIEEAQREAVKIREATSKPWETVLFRKGGEEGWEYINPLKCRLQQCKINQENVHSNSQDSQPQHLSNVNIPSADIAISFEDDNRSSKSSILTADNSWEENSSNSSSRY